MLIILVLLNTVNSLYSGQCRDLELVSLLARVRKSESLFQSILCNFFYRGFSCCPYYRGVRKAKVDCDCWRCCMELYHGIVIASFIGYCLAARDAGSNFVPKTNPYCNLSLDQDGLLTEPCLPPNRKFPNDVFKHTVLVDLQLGWWGIQSDRVSGMGRATWKASHRTSGNLHERRYGSGR